MAESAVIKKITALITPILADLGLDLYDLDFGAGLLKITVDQPGGVNLDTIALVTRLVNRELDHDDPVPGKYTLEVSSPGIERALRRPDHFTRVIGSTINVRLRDVSNESRRVQGILLAADEQGITVRTDDKTSVERTMTYDQIDRARTVFVWGPETKGDRPSGATRAPKAVKAASGRATPPTNQEVTA